MHTSRPLKRDGAAPRSAGIDLVSIVVVLATLLCAALANGQGTCYRDPATGRVYCQPGASGGGTGATMPRPSFGTYAAPPQQQQPQRQQPQRQQQASQAWLEWRRGQDDRLARLELHVTAIEQRLALPTQAGAMPPELVKRFEDGAQLLERLRQDVATLKAAKPPAVVDTSQFVTTREIQQAAQAVNSEVTTLHDRVQAVKDEAVAAAVSAAQAAASTGLATAATQVAVQGLPSWLPVLGGISGPAGLLVSGAAVWMLRRLSKRLGPAPTTINWTATQGGGQAPPAPSPQPTSGGPGGPPASTFQR